MSWFGDTVAGLKRIIQLDADVARLQQDMEQAKAAVMDHEKRLIRVEALIHVNWALPQLRQH